MDPKSHSFSSAIEQIRALDSKWLDTDNVGRWIICNEKEGPRIKRTIRTAQKVSFQRLPILMYKSLNFKQLENLVSTLNYDKDTDLRNAFISHSTYLPDEYLKGFYNQLENEIPTPAVVKHNYSHLRKYFLNFFLEKSPDPKKWKDDFELDWSNYLLSTKLSPRSLRNIIHISNRFMKYLNRKDASAFKVIKFEPITRAMFRKYSSDWVENEKKKFRQFVPESLYKKMLSRMPNELRPVFILCYQFGLRRSESLGLYGSKSAVRKDYLRVERQLRRYTNTEGPIYDRTKNRTGRKVPYWYSSPQEAYGLINSIVPLDPHKYSKLFTAFNEAEGFTITLHDLRHTFITNAVNNKEYGINDVRLAVGHSDLSITSKYLKDSRDFDESVWVPSVK